MGRPAAGAAEAMEAGGRRRVRPRGADAARGGGGGGRIAGAGRRMRRDRPERQEAWMGARLEAGRQGRAGIARAVEPWRRGQAPLPALRLVQGVVGRNSTGI